MNHHRELINVPVFEPHAQYPPLLFMIVQSIPPLFASHQLSLWSICTDERSHGEIMASKNDFIAFGGRLFFL